MRIDVSKLIDEGRWTGYLMLLIAGAALTVILDGMDNQLLGAAQPTLETEWSLPRSAFKTALALSPLGMMIGGAIGGILGDRIGRRTSLLGSVLAFAVPTACIYFAENVQTLGALRFLAGLGLGGAMPNATALVAEYVPRRLRPIAVTVTIVCIPVGAMLAAFISKHVIPDFGWRVYFLGGGAVPMLVGAILFWVLPESPHYLARQRHRWPELITMLRRMGHDIPADAEFVEANTGRPAGKRASVFDLFTPEFRRDTFALFGAFFFGLMISYLPLQLLVTALKGVGIEEAQARDTLGWWNIGGVIGALMGSLIIQRLGSRTTLLGLAAIAIATAFWLAFTARESMDSSTLLPWLLILSCCINAVQVGMYSLVAHVYPTEIRGRGVGTVLAVGRIGNVLASYVGIYALEAGGLSAYFSAFGIGMIVVFVALAVLRRHIDGTAAATAAAGH